MRSEVGSILSLIAGILELIVAATFILISIPLMITIVLGIFFFSLGGISLVLGVLMVKSYGWMREDKTVMKGGVTALVCGILALNLIAIVGGIFGLIDADKPVKRKNSRKRR